MVINREDKRNKEPFITSVYFINKAAIKRSYNQRRTKDMLFTLFATLGGLALLAFLIESILDNYTKEL